ncbi:CAP domain-containing protein (plasmid) [Cytobacillus spongiae]|uniref:CAP domain-containing protein n=1 Tax=Cytobacillus spongiae TaxID=2901381 RepID=UPI001F3A6722|nr:CAP domain-containing protein [Cytobacillus spongiae]UII58630.1 CAP domain-containing protein [Cytobacillus spongiae]
MNKKMIISTATAFTLLAAPFAGGKADAAAPFPTDKVAHQVNAFIYSGNQEDLNKFVQDTLAKYQIDGKNINIQELLKGHVPQGQAAPAPANGAPKAEAPAPEQKEAPKAEAPAPEQKEAPKREAPAPAPAPAANEQKQQQASEEAGQLSQYEQKVVELTNQERAKQGLPALKVDPELSKVAREKSRDMQANNYFSHDSPTYGSPFDMMKQFGIQYNSAGENIAMGQTTPEEVVQAWMNSDGHRKNILSSNFTHIGVGYVENGNYWTQQFIGK